MMLVLYFFNENDTTKTVLYGASMVEVQGTGRDGPNGRRQWVFDATADVIGDLYLRLAVEVPSNPSDLGQDTNSAIGITTVEYAVSQPMGCFKSYRSYRFPSWYSNLPNNV